MGLKPPIIIVGSMRAGKTTLAGVLAELPGLCVWSEPNVLLTTGHAFRDTDTASATDAKPWVRRHMNRMALRFQHEHGNARIIIEGPMATLRVLFLLAVFPGLKIIHLHRDGRVVVCERLNDAQVNRSFPLMGKSKMGRVHEQLQQLHWRDLAALPLKLSRTLKWRFEKDCWYGTRYPGWREDRHKPPPEIAAIQWSREVELGLGELSRLPQGSSINVSSESLRADPAGGLQELTEFCGIRAGAAQIERLAHSFRRRTAESTPAPADTVDLQALLPIMRPTLERLGYL